MPVKVVDLHDTCLGIGYNESVVQARLDKLVKLLPSVAITAVGGFPIKKKLDGLFYWCGNLVEDNTFPDNILDALGTAAVLTYTNPKNKTLEELGLLCAKLDHSWALHWVTVTLVFAGHPPAVELAFARDTRFRMSWTVGSTSGKVFAATAGIKEWRDYLYHRSDQSFGEATRIAMHEAYLVLECITP